MKKLLIPFVIVFLLASNSIAGFNGFLKADTAVTIKVGPFLDSTDGNTNETGLTISQADVRLSKNGGNIAQKNQASACTHDELGYYDCSIDTTDTNTEGRLKVVVHESGALLVEQTYQVVNANVYDSLMAAATTDYLQTDMLQMAGSTQSGTDLKDFADAGYDPVTNKVQGVLLVDTTTTNSDMRGTDSAGTAAELAKVPKSDGTVTWNATALASMQSEATDALNAYDPPTDAELDARTLAAASYATASKQTDLETDTQDIQTKLGTPTDFGSGTSTIAANLQDLADNGTAVYDRATDSQQALRDRGDAAWVTGGGGSISDIVHVTPLIPVSIDNAGTATVRIALGLTNALDDLPSTAEITPGTITIDRKTPGSTSWTNVVNAAACSEAAGLIYYDEVFDTGTGYRAGDSIRITFKSQKVTVAANDYDITDATGWIFFTHIRGF